MATAALTFPRYHRAASSGARARPRPLHIALENTVMWVLAFAAYIAVASYLVFHLHYMINDALTRVDNAFDVLYSRDPHLGAIGFFWPPLPSFFDIPILAFKGLWPPLATQGFAGSIEAAAFSAGSVVLVNVGMRWAGVVRGMRWVICLVFLMNPMVMIFASQGMAEAPFVFFFMAATLVFLRWSENQRAVLLPLMGIMAGCAALCRSEAVLFAVVLGGGVIVQSLRNERNWRRIETEALMYALPCLLFIGLWALTAAILFRNPLYIIQANNVVSGAVSAPAAAATSSGASSIVSQGIATPVITAATWGLAVQYVVTHAILLFPAVGAMVWMLAARMLAKKGRVAGAVLLACGAATLVVDVYLVHGRGLGNYLRYQIVVIPLAYVIAMYILRSVRSRRALLSSLLALAMGVVLGVSNLLTAQTLSNPTLGLEEYPVMASLTTGQPVQGGGDYGDLDTTPLQLKQILALDSDHGLILCDSAFCFAWNLMAPDPQQFVVTSDRDWQAALYQPQVYHVEYFLVPSPTGVSAGDSLNRLYPSLWNDGGGFSILVGGTSDGQWRLYRITGPTGLG